MSKTDLTLDTILNAAGRLFVEKNYADVSMRDIARAADVSTGALYHHFPGKEKLYYALLTRYMARLRQITLEAIPAEGSCRERLRALTRVYLGLPRVQRELMRLVRRDLGVFEGPMRAGIVDAYQAAVPALVQGVLEEAIARHELKPQDARWLAWAYVGIVETTLGEYATRKLGKLDARLDAALDLFLWGARADV